MKFNWAHIAIGIITALATISPQLAKAYPDVAWLVALCGVVTQLSPIALGALGVGSASAVSSVNAKAVAAKVASAALLVGLAVLCSGCIPDAPIVAVTPANSPQVSSCQTTAATHNDVVVGDFVFGGVGVGLGSAAAFVSDTGLKNGLAIGSASAAALVGIGTAVAGLSASSFVNSHCSDVVGALPVFASPPAPSSAPAGH